jgi:glycosyltransferase involved in cell wall biosynthesis
LNRKKRIGIYFPTFGSGGARRHLSELLVRWDNNSDVIFILFGPKELEKVIPYPSSIKFQRVSALEKGFLIRFLWELFISHRIFNNLSVLFVPLGSYVGLFRPFVTMSRNLLLYDNKEIARIDLFSTKIITYLNRYVQLFCFDNASRIIFISEYARKIVCGIRSSYKHKSLIINHGISDDFFFDQRKHNSISEYSKNKPFKILYVSSFYEYKNHKILFESISKIAINYPIKLILIGEFPSYKMQDEFNKLINIYNAKYSCEIIEVLQNLNLNEVGEYYKSSDMFVFPSSVENMPNILIEAMASSLPIASSNVPPMPEFLGNCGFYFDPYNIDSINNGILSLINNLNLREELSNKAQNRASRYSWDTTSKETLSLLLEIIK